MSFRGWTGYNCLRSCVATLLNLAIDRVPEHGPFVRDGMFDLDGYSEKLAGTVGYRFREISMSQCPPGERYWIALMRTSHAQDETHAIACRGGQLLHDPGDVFRAYQPSTLEYRLVLVAA